MIATVLNLHVGARAATLKPSIICSADLAHAHDVVDLNPLARRRRQASERLGRHLLGVADDVIDLGHVGKALGLDLRRATRHDDASLGLLAAKSSIGLRGLTYGFTGHGAGIDDDRIMQARRLRRDGA